jgi:prevent-host-death family protein
MKAGVAQLKAGLSRYLERVKAGHEVVVTDRGQPVARIVPIGTAALQGSRRARLVREGTLIPGRGRVRASLLRRPAGSATSGRAVLDALLEDRREGFRVLPEAR